MVKVEIEDPLEEEHGPLNKRSKFVDSFWQLGTGGNMVLPQAMHYNPLDEPSPLGLRLRKSPSLLDLIQMRLSQVNSAATSCIMNHGSFEVGRKKELATTDKMKASNFSASLLRIGTWECLSRYEGDLVAKCYFAKQKLVWEVLDGGLMKKIEIQWSDITALKATCPEDGPATLEIVLARQPLFFRETNPQPRKHTLWQATPDFTNGQASMHRRHFLQFSQGVLNKHFEKLIQCDPRLYTLSQQPEIILASPYFGPQCSIFDDLDEYKCHGVGNLKDNYGSSRFHDSKLPCAAPPIFTKSDVRDPIGMSPGPVARKIPSPNSEMDARVAEENPSSETKLLKNPPFWAQIEVPGLHASMSMNDLVNHIEHCISERVASGNPLLSGNSLPNKDMLEELAQYLLSDSQAVASASDEQSLISRVNSLCCLLQKDPPRAQTQQINNSDCIKAISSPDNMTTLADGSQPSGNSRKESLFEELLSSLP